MDIRIEKTKRSIKNAFIELRSRKSLERITVKEVCEKAEINKSTFYSHYQDIYDLSDKLETEVVESIISALNHPENLLKNPEEFTKELYLGYAAKNALIFVEIFLCHTRSSYFHFIFFFRFNYIDGRCCGVCFCHPFVIKEIIKDTW